ncbi:MAG: hypothetical protein AABY22_11510 [Nanoarchaeota archaeon]
MKSAFYILIMRQIGNVGANEIVKIKDQPKEGFVSEKSARNHLSQLMKNGDYPFDRNWNLFMISELYSKTK